ncbi:F0F1 ATP synthase subunit delta [Spiroplasma litorale]|uniref:ATP synthase subunit delta n=1 Tax=Spiroplasma litorale TaxID=216942 RepID=A0A0K1W079_9MOLU|nr:F0F1 ATP synthase subunit delta [Spiroplasma litorale]AKX33715.1 F0F1 ATP synthase subunit delta [Spiroplasma litorale]
MERQNIIHNWATAISDIAIDNKKSNEYIEDLKSLLVMFEANPEIQNFLSNNFVDEDTKEKIIESSLQKKADENIINALKLMIKRKVFGSVQQIFKYSLKLIWESMNIEHGIIYSSTKINNSTIEVIEKKLSSKLNKNINLENIIDENIIAGIVVEVANKSYDFSVKGKLEDMKNKLKENRS